MASGSFLNMTVLIAQFIGIAIPLVGIFVLINKEQSKTAMNLLIADIGCLIMNVAYYFMLRAKGLDEATLSLRVEYLGSTIFYTFFIKFILSYMQIDRKHKIMDKLAYIWLAFESAVLLIFWTGRSDLVLKKTEFLEEKAAGYHYIDIEYGKVYMARYTVLSIVLAALAVYMIVRRVKLRRRKGLEKHYLSNLLAAGAVIIVSFIMELTVHMRLNIGFLSISFNFVPICASIAVLVIIVSVVGGDFFSIMDIGRGWVFENIDDVFVIVDNTYGYLDANACAKQYFPELNSLRKGDCIPARLYKLFRIDKTNIELEDRYFEREVKILEQNSMVRGFCLMMMDLTKQYKLMNELEEEKIKAEEANRAKSDFLSNMSHEIRTPMNAIVGMTEILLRSDMGQQERGYLTNIKNSGAALLEIINDILDFSKIESGKIEIIEDEYEPMSMLSDLGMIFLNRIGDKPIELLFDVDKELPLKLYGDSLRIRQVIVNMVNNAIKFTEEGSVKLTIKMTHIEEYQIRLDVSVKDTGQGIRKEDMNKLFGVFQQVDTKRNRTKEGSGLGLSISKRFVDMMGGTIGVNSEYGKGSEFYFSVPQRIISGQRAATVKEEIAGSRQKLVSGLMHIPELMETLKNLAEGYGMRYIDCYEAEKNKTEIDFFFVDGTVYQQTKEVLMDYFSTHATDLFVLQNPMQDAMWEEHVTTVNKPLYTLNFCQAVNHEKSEGLTKTDNGMNFIAPEAKILIVDDNEMNLKVACGLLQPLQMQIDTAESGKKAIELVQSKQYHIVFMDHMMPVMDGVETTQKIRALDNNFFRTMPIIALTANAVAGAKEIFVKAGMNDFVAKPIEIKDICAKIKRWLPSDLICKSEKPVDAPRLAEATELPVIEGLNVEEGVKNSGSLELFINLLGDFYKLIDMKSTKIEKCLADGMIRDYTIEVHALKNTARMIGAIELSELFYKMEQCGNAEDLETIERENPHVMELYRSYKPILEPYGKANEQDKKEVPKAEIIAALDKLNTAMDSFDLDGADAALEELEQYRLPEALGDMMESLRAFVADVAMEEVMEMSRKMIEALES